MVPSSPSTKERISKAKRDDLISKIQADLFGSGPDPEVNPTPSAFADQQ